MSRARAEELVRMRDELSEKFSDAMKSINDKIAAEQNEESDNYKAVGKAAADLAKVTGSRAAGVMALRQFPRGRAAAVAMSPEHESELIDLKDRLLDAIHRVNQPLCGEDPDADDDVEDANDLDPDDVDGELDDELAEIGLADPVDAASKELEQKRAITPIEYSLHDRRALAFKEGER